MAVTVGCANKVDAPEGWNILTKERFDKCSNIHDESLFTCMASYRTPPTIDEITWLKNRMRQRMVYVKGGKFLEGDLSDEKDFLQDNMRIGEIYEPSIYGPYSKNAFNSKENKDSKLINIQIKRDENFSAGPSRLVRLNDFKLSSHWIENQEYNLFAGAKGYPMTPALMFGIEGFNYTKEAPAAVTWDKAQEYCEWLGEKMNEVMSLPTEAQWEYAARSRGQYRLFGTNTGLFQDGKNVLHLLDSSSLVGFSREGYLADFAAELKKLPPNELGIYYLHVNSEFVYDWYQPSIIAQEFDNNDNEVSQEIIQAELNRQSVVLNPKGPRYCQINSN